jgi:hypothetical protein
MHHLSRILVVFLLTLSFSVMADDLDFSSMSLDQLKAFETAGLAKDQTKAHKKALKKAQKAARKAARKANPQRAYCSRSAKARGACS